MCRDEFVIHLALWNLNWRNEGFFLYLFLVVGLQEFYIHIPCSSQKATKKKKNGGVLEAPPLYSLSKKIGHRRGGRVKCS